MIHDQVFRAQRRDRIFRKSRTARLAIVARPYTEVLDDHILRLHIKAAANERDPRRGRSLPGNGNVGIGDGNRFLFKVDDTAHLEHDDPRPLHCYRFPEAARPMIGQRGHPDDFPAAPAIGIG